MSYDQDGNLLTKTDGAGNAFRYFYDLRGNLRESVDPNGHRQRFDYDAQDQMIQATDIDGRVTQYSYGPGGELTAVVYPTGEWYRFAHDAQGHLVRVDGAEGRVVAFEYDAAHNVILRTDARGFPTRYAYDAMGRPVAAMDALGRTTTVEYDAMGRRTRLTLPRWRPGKDRRDGTHSERVQRSNSLQEHRQVTEHPRWIVVPKDADALSALDVDEASSEQLVEWRPTDREFVELWESGVFQLLNAATGAIIDDFEDERLLGAEKLAAAEEVLQAFASPRDSTMKLVRRLRQLVQLAYEVKTGVFFFF